MNHRWFVAAAILLMAGHSAVAAAELTSRGLVVVEVDGKTSAITALTNRLTNERHQVRTIPWRIKTEARSISPTAARDSGSDERSAWFTYQQDAVSARLTYATVPNADCIEVTLEITNAGKEAITLDRVVAADFEFTPGIASAPPALEGALPADRGQVHGTAHCIDGGGFVFLFLSWDELPSREMMGRP